MSKADLVRFLSIYSLIYLLSFRSFSSLVPFPFERVSAIHEESRVVSKKENKYLLGMSIDFLARYSG